MKRTLPLVILILAVILASCTTFGNGKSAKANSIQALVTTTRSVKLLVTSAALLADSGVISEAQWSKIAAKSVEAGNALQLWSDAIKANKSTTDYELIVAQALTVIAALLPQPKPQHSMNAAPFAADDVPIAISRMLRPSVFRHQIAGGV